MFDLTLIVPKARSTESIAEIIKENCRKIGVRRQIIAAKWSLMLEKLRKKEFDAVILGWGDELERRSDSRSGTAARPRCPTVRIRSAIRIPRPTS